ncbi:MAG: integrin alpha, partial [Myxococcota bacterium]
MRLALAIGVSVVLGPLLTTESWTADPTDQMDALFGSSVASAGDVDGDGFGDVVVGAWNWSGEATGEGRAFLFLGSAAGLAGAPLWTADPTDQANTRFGWTVTGAGDVNGDGYGDVVVGAPNWSDGTVTEGRVYLYYGGPAGLSTTSSWTADPADQASAGFGFSSASAGDVNADGYADLIVGSPNWDGEAANEGRVYLYLGGPAGLTVTPSWVADPTDQLGAGFGFSVASAGDVNADGYGDVIVGAISWTGTATGEGRAYLYLGGPTGLSTSPSWTADPTDQTGAAFGASAASAGDIDGDGFGDVIVGASWWNGTSAGEGRAYVYFGSAAGLVPNPSWTADPADQIAALFGSSVGAAGDVNGDGYADVFVCASAWNGAASSEGRAYLYLGGSTGLSASPAWTADPTDQSVEVDPVFRTTPIFAFRGSSMMKELSHGEEELEAVRPGVQGAR